MTESVGASVVENRAVALESAAGGRPSGRLRPFVAMAAFEFHMAARSRWTLASTAAFCAAALGISYFGLFGAGYLEFQGFERTAISLLSLVVYLGPLLGLVLGLGSFSGAETLDLLFAQPAGRAVVVVGKLAGLTLAIAASAATGLGLSGLMIAAQVGADGVAGYLALVAVSVMLGGIFAGVAALSGLVFRDRLQASGAAVGIWVWFVFLYEMVVLGVLFMVPEVSVRPLLVVSVACSPVTIARVLVLVALGAEPVLGPSGAMLLRTFGDAGALGALVTALVAWLGFTWVGAVVVARRRDA